MSIYRHDLRDGLEKVFFFKIAIYPGKLPLVLLFDPSLNDTLKFQFHDDEMR